MVNTLFSTCLYLFEEEFGEKLSASEYFFVNSHQNIAICTISDYQTMKF